MSNEFVKLMADPDYKRRDTEAREEAERRQRERIARNSAPENTNPNGPSRSERLREMIREGREFNFENAALKGRSRSVPQIGGQQRGKRGSQFASQKDRANDSK